jgi:Tol biopolymer transport system component
MKSSFLTSHLDSDRVPSWLHHDDHARSCRLQAAIRNGFSSSLVLALAFLRSATLTAADNLRPASAVPQAGISAAGGSFAPSFSADGRFVLFVSQANNLVTNDDLGLGLDVFVSDLQASKIVLVSVSTAGTGGADADAVDPSISADGRFVAFASAAGNLVLGDTNQVSDIFVRDLLSGVTTLESRDRDGSVPATPYPGGRRPLLSADGRWVFFESTATNLTAEPDGAGTPDVFARDRQSEITRLVSVTRDGTGGFGPTDKAELGGMTPDGRYAAFLSPGTNFATGVTMSAGEVYVRDLEGAATWWASSNAAGLLGVPPAGYQVLNAALSDDGHFLAFKAVPSPRGSNTAVHVFRHDLASGSSALLGSEARDDAPPQISADGRFVAFESNKVILLHDATAGTNAIVSVGADGSLLAAVSRQPVLAADGQKLVFLGGDASNLVCQIWLYDAAEGRAHVAALAQDGGPGLVMPTITPALSRDGSRLGFESPWEGWISNDLNRASDVFVSELAGSTVQLLSSRAASLPALTAYGVRTAGTNCLSADGRWLVFRAYDSNLAPGDTNAWADLFIRDLWHGTNLMVGRQTNAVNWPMISRDGTHLAWAGAPIAPGNVGTGAFTEFYLNLVWRDLAVSTNTLAAEYRWDTPFVPDSSPKALSSDGRYLGYLGSASNQATLNVWIKDMRSGAVQLVSTNRVPNPPFGYTSAFPGQCTMPQFTPDAQWVLFRTTATNVATNILVTTQEQLFACNLAGGFTHMISRTADEALGITDPAVVSENSRLVVFTSLSPTNRAAPQGVYVRDLQAETTTLVASNARTPSISEDGHWVAYQSWDPVGTGPLTNQVMVRDTVAGTTELISLNQAGTGPGNGISSAPLISRDGRYVVFVSQASDLVEDDTNGQADLFVRDRTAGRTFAITVSRSGGTAYGVLGPAFLGADGRTVVFNSFAGDLVDGDYNDGNDVFVLRLGAPDGDGDGMDDDWEIAYFNTLARDGTGDYDGDGATDYQEFVAGTDPSDRGSVLRAFVLRAVSGGGAKLFWPVASDRTYRVQYKNGLQDPGWTDLGAPVEIANGMGTATDETGSETGERFYRVVVEPAAGSPGL